MNLQTTGTLRDVEAQFNSFCAAFDSVVDAASKAAVELTTSQSDAAGVQRMATALRSAAMFAFEGSTCTRIIELAQAEPQSLAITAAPMPFESVVLVDATTAVAMLDVVDHEPTPENDFMLRTLRVVITGRSAEAHDDWTLMAASLQFSAADMPCAVDISTIERRGRAGSYRLGFSSPVLCIIHARGQHQAFQIPADVVPLTRDDPIPPRGEIDKDTLFRALMRDVITSVTSAMEQLWYINLPRHHIVEQVPHHVINNAEKMRRRAGIKLPRFNDRPRYILVEPEKVAKIRPSGSSTDAGGTHASPTPHFRAGYTRVLRSARFKHKRWAVVNVRPTWVGDEEWDFGKIRFRVVSPGTKL